MNFRFLSDSLHEKKGCDGEFYYPLLTTLVNMPKSLSRFVRNAVCKFPSTMRTAQFAVIK